MRRPGKRLTTNVLHKGAAPGPPTFRRDGGIMAEASKVYTMEELLDTSQAMPEFKESVHAMVHGENQDRITYNWGAPPVKILRVIMKILETCPQEPIEVVTLKAESGCSNFKGTAVLEPGNLQVNFDWDCRWRAEQMGWKDFFGEPDQIRAAHEFGYQCFKRFEIERPETPQVPADKIHVPRQTFS